MPRQAPTERGRRSRSSLPQRPPTTDSLLSNSPADRESKQKERVARCWPVPLAVELAPSRGTRKPPSTDPVGCQSSLQQTRVTSPSSNKRRKDLTVERIIFDAVWILPLRTADGEHGARGATQWKDRAGAILWGLIDDEVQRTRAGLCRKHKHHFESPIGDRSVRQK